MMNFMFAKNKTGFIDGSIKKPETKSDKYLPWMRCDVMIKGWLTTTMEKEIRNSVKYAKTAADIWNNLKERFGKESAPKAYELKQSLATTRQDGTTVSVYYMRLRILWDEMESILPTPRCTCNGYECGLGKKLTELNGKERTYEFLMGLDDQYPEWWQRKGKGDKSKPKAAMVEMKPCPISGMTEEQYAMFLKLFACGLGCHRTHNPPRTLLKNLFMNTIERPITIPNGESIPVKGKGEVVFKGGLNIKGVLFVPNFTCNLLSVRRLTKDLRCVVTFFPDFFVLQDLKSGNLIGAGDCRGGLYWMGGIKEERKAMTVTIDAWHRRLRHASNIKFSRVSFLKDVSLSLIAKVCDSCNKAKLTRLPFPISSTKTSNCFDLIHCDIWGKYKRPSLTGANYFLTIVDDYSRAVWVYLLKHKHETSLITNNTKIQLDLPLITEVMSKAYLVSSHASGPRSDETLAMASRTIRKAIHAAKDQTSISIAKVARNVAPDLERFYMSECDGTVSKRLSKTNVWIMALKALMLIHRLLVDGDPAFEQEIMFAKAKRGQGL
nr:hypothetical protein [Tanacetum cinerariifolium]